MAEEGPSFFDKPDKTSYLLFVFILGFIGVLVFLDFIDFHRLYLFKDMASDGINGAYSNLIGNSEYLKKYGHLSWSFNIGMGQDITHTVLENPFNIFLYLLPADKIAYFIGWREVIKIWASGLIFFAYLRILEKGSFASLAGALMFSFCAYIIVGGQWSFSFDGFNTALFLLGFELLYQKNIPWLFPLPVFLLGISNPFNLVLITIFILIYAIFRYLQDNDKGIKGVGVLYMKMAGLGIIGLIISSPILADHIKAMLESARGSGPNSYFKTLSSAPVFALSDHQQLGTAIARFFCSDMLWTADFYKGWGNYLEGPMFYCGIPCLLLTPLLFGYLKRREKILFGGLLFIWILPVFFPYFRRAFWLFSGDYYRTYSFYVSLIFLFFSVTCLDRLDKQKKLNIILLALVAAVLILIQFLPLFDDKMGINETIAIASKIYILAYAAIFLWMSRRKTDLPKFVFIALLVSELTWFSSIPVKRSTSISATEWESTTGFKDHSNEVLNFIKNRENSFYRIDKSFGSSPAENKSLNDAEVQKYYSTMSYSSFNQKYYLKYLWTNDVIDTIYESETRWCHGLIERPILQCLNSVKYIMTKKPLYPNDSLHDSVAKFGDVALYSVKFPMPLGFCYDKFIKYSEFKKLTITQKDYTSCRACVVNDADVALVKNLKSFQLKDTLLPDASAIDKLKGFFTALKQDTFSITSFNPAHIKGAIQLKSSKLMYLSIPYDIGWHLKVDGKEQKIILVAQGMIGVLLDAGTHEVELDYDPPFRRAGNLLSLFGICLYGGVVFLGYKTKPKAFDKKQ